MPNIIDNAYTGDIPTDSEVAAMSPRLPHDLNETHDLGFGTSTPSMGIELEPVVHASSRWVPNSVSRKPIALDSDSTEIVDRKVRALLNKLTAKKFDSISDQIIAWANKKSEKEENGMTIIQVVKLVYEKATDEEMWSELYARLSRELVERISLDIQEAKIKDGEGKPIAGAQFFRELLLQRCQADLERGRLSKGTAVTDAAIKFKDHAAATNPSSGNEERIVFYSEEYYAAQKAKRQCLGLIRFMGELFKLQMLSERIMHEVIKGFLSNENPWELEIEMLCKLLLTIGSILDTDKARHHMDVYFSRMKESYKSSNGSARLRFMLLVGFAFDRFFVVNVDVFAGRMLLNFGSEIGFLAMPLLFKQ